MYHAHLLDTLPRYGVSPMIGVRTTENEHLCSVMPELRDKRPGRKFPYDRSISERLYRVLGNSRAVPRRLRNKYYAFDLLREGEFDIFHPTYYDPSFLEYHDGPFVLTLHDFTPELFPGLLTRQENLIEAKRELSKRARRIIAISEATKSDAIRILGLEEDKIDVIHHGYSRMKDNQADVAVTGLPTRYMLFVGGRSGYKNFDFFVSSFARISEKNPDLQILCTGRPFANDEVERLRSHGLSSKVNYRAFRDAELPYAYAGAIGFVFPSLYEGFGLPILEAFSAGCPVLLSDIPVFHEIAGDAAVYFDPRNEESLAEALLAILGSEERRDTLVKRGTERLGGFSWDVTARETRSCYERALA